MSDELNTEGFVSGETETAPPVVEEAVTEQAEAEEEVTTDEIVEEQPKRRQTAQDRIDEVTRLRREAEREAKYWRDVAMGKVQPEQRQEREEGPKAPSPDNYPGGEYDPDYQAALVDYKVEVKLSQAGLDKIDERVAQHLERQAGARAWEARQDAARAKFADYDEKVISGAHNWPCTPEMAEAIKTSDVGGELAYRLASNPEEARRISALPIIAQIRELGRLEASVSMQSRPQAKAATDAPKPPAGQARGAGGQFSPSPETDDFKSFEASFASKW